MIETIGAVLSIFLTAVKLFEHIKQKNAVQVIETTIELIKHAETMNSHENKSDQNASRVITVIEGLKTQLPQFAKSKTNQELFDHVSRVYASYVKPTLKTSRPGEALSGLVNSYLEGGNLPIEEIIKKAAATVTEKSK